MRNKLYILVAIIGTFLTSFAFTAHAIGTPIQITGGGTNATTTSISQLIYGGKNQYNGFDGYRFVATTTVSCTGSASCTPFTVIGGAPVTITGSGSGGTGLSTSTNPAVSSSQALYYNATGAGSASGVATSSIASGTNITVANGSTAFVLGAQPTINLSGTVAYGNGGTGSTTAPVSQLLYGGTSSYQSVATGTVSAGSSAITVTAGRAAVGGALAIDCATAGAGQNGCLSSTDWSTFNGKGSGTVTSIVAGNGLLGGTITTTGTIALSSYIATSSAETISNLAYWTSTGGTPATLGKVATSSLGVTSPITFSGTIGAQIGGTGGSFGCATCLTSYDGFVHNGTLSSSATTTTFFGHGTTTPAWALQIASTSASTGTFGQLALTDNNAAANLKHWLFSSQRGQLSFSTTSDVYATSSIAAFSIDLNGAANIRNTLAVNSLVSGNCVQAGTNGLLTTVGAACGSGGGSDPFTHAVSNQSATTTAFGIGTTSPFSQLAVSTSTQSSPFTKLFTVASTTGREILSVLGNGNVGIGTTTPDSRLVLSNNTFTGATPAPVAGTVFHLIGADGANTRMTLESFGGLPGIGSSRADGTAASKTAVQAGDILGIYYAIGWDGTSAYGLGGAQIRLDATENFTTTNQGTDIQFLTTTNGTTGANEVMRLDNNGNVGVGTTSPWRQFSVAGTAAFPGLTGASGLQAADVCLSSKGELIADSALCVASAKRFKHDIQPLSGSLTEIMKLNPVSFYWRPEFNGSLQSNPNYSGQQLGLVSDELQKVDPRLITVETGTSTDGTIHSYPGQPHGLNIESLIGLMMGGIQDVAKQVESILNHQSMQDAEIKQLQAEVSALQAQLKNK